jgi:hypothetical protein
MVLACEKAVCDYDIGYAPTGLTEFRMLGMNTSFIGQFRSKVGPVSDVTFVIIRNTSIGCLHTSGNLQFPLFKPYRKNSIIYRVVE